MVTVVSPHLLVAGAAWDDGPDAGGWIAGRLAPFGASVGHAVPLGYPAYAVVPIPVIEGPETEPNALSVLAGVLGVLDRLTGDQPVHSAMWDGWPGWYDTGGDPRTPQGLSVWVAWPEGEDRPSQDEMDRELAAAREELAADSVERPDADPLELPNRTYFLWTGPLRSAAAFRQWPHGPPSLIWPEDRSWFVGVPIYTNEIAVAGSSAVVEAVLADSRLEATRAAPDDVMDHDD